MTGMFSYPDEVCCVCGKVPNWGKTQWGPFYCDEHNKERLAEERKQKRLVVRKQADG